MPNDPSLPYLKPPIIEAVIALHFAESLEQKDIDTFARKSLKHFPRSDEIIETRATLNPQMKQSVADFRKVGRKLYNVDPTFLIMITANQFGVIQQAPYTNWDIFCKEARSHWNVLKKIIAYKPVSRVSTRYINRIDIPVGDDGYVDLKKYFNVGLSLPTYTQGMTLQNFFLNTALRHKDGEYMNVLQVAATPSPLINHLSVMIDIDIATTGEVPVDEDKMWTLINGLRKYKNDLFESCITPDTRNLFQ